MRSERLRDWVRYLGPAQVAKKTGTEKPRWGTCCIKCLTREVFPDPEGAEKIMALPDGILIVRLESFDGWNPPVYQVKVVWCIWF